MNIKHGSMFQSALFNVLSEKNKIQIKKHKQK